MGSVQEGEMTGDTDARVGFSKGARLAQVKAGGRDGRCPQPKMGGRGRHTDSRGGHDAGVDRLEKYWVAALLGLAADGKPLIRVCPTSCCPQMTPVKLFVLSPSTARHP